MHRVQSTYEGQSEQRRCYRVYESGTSLTRRGNHPLPLLKQRRLQTIPWTKRVRFMPRHEFLHGFEDYT